MVTTVTQPTTGLSEAEASSLLQRDEDQLYEMLGIRLAATRENTALQGQYNLDVEYGAHMGPAEDLRKIGKRMVKTLNRQAYGLVCGNDPEDTADRNKILSALNLSVDAAVIALTTVLVGTFGLAAALAGTVAALIVKRFAVEAIDDGHETMCELWKEKLD
jgi:hypothetical protein